MSKTSSEMHIREIIRLLFFSLLCLLHTVMQIYTCLKHNLDQLVGEKNEKNIDQKLGKINWILMES